MIGRLLARKQRGWVKLFMLNEDMYGCNGRDGCCWCIRNFCQEKKRHKTQINKIILANKIEGKVITRRVHVIT